MASERTCGECRDCRHWGHSISDRTRRCLNQKSPAIDTQPDFGCVLFEAKPAPKVAAFLALDREYATLDALQAAVTANPDRVRDISHFTHVYSSADLNYLFRYEEDQTP